MKTLIKIAIIALVIHSSAQAQEKWYTRNGTISLFSATSMENIDASNNEVFSMLDQNKKELAFQVLVTGFKFKKALMQEHFNENYMESGKYPKASFQGTIADPSKVNFDKDGDYNVTVTGNLNMHGVSNKVNIPATIHVANKKVSGESKFDVKLADYNIKVPTVVAKQVSETVSVSVNCQYEPFTR
jgi:polyisoprenoid-binding protein YceI